MIWFVIVGMNYAIAERQTIQLNNKSVTPVAVYVSVSNQTSYLQLSQCLNGHNSVYFCKCLNIPIKLGRIC